MPRTKKDECEPDGIEHESWRIDQKRRQYYYDDAHGYEKYVPDDDKDGESDPEDDEKAEL